MINWTELGKWDGRHRDSTRQSAIPPKICEECGMVWTSIKEPLKVEGRTRWFSMWEYLQDFPTIGCDIEVCPKCCERPRHRYKEIG